MATQHLLPDSLQFGLDHTHEAARGAACSSQLFTLHWEPGASGYSVIEAGGNIWEISGKYLGNI